MQTLERRVRQAAERVCQAPNGKVSVSELRYFRTCHDQAVERAMALIQAGSVATGKLVMR